MVARLTQCHGINLPLNALRSKENHGIGDFYDLLSLIPWCQKIGFNLLQLLPLNDSGWDPSPYNALSAYALHPLYLRLTALPRFSEHADLLKEAENLKPLGQTKRLSYHAVLTLKTDILNSYIQKERVHLNAALPAFYARFPWLKTYALFKTLKEVHSQIHWNRYPPDHQRGFSEELAKEYAEGIERHSLLQLLCFQQWAHVRAEAQKAGIKLMGDLPILISADSADVWQKRRYFDLNLQAGAPPDFYNPKGQNWGSPLYHWDELEKEGFGWWKERLKVCEMLYDFYRIDHIVGFFRIWGIKVGESAAQGRFVPENEALWHPQGEKLIQMLLDNCQALPIGEDLGTVPPSVKAFLSKKNICGMRVLRWERYWDEDGRFIPVESYPKLSLSTVSTHDSETLAQWWRDQKQDAQLYAGQRGWHYKETLDTEQRHSILLDSHRSGSLLHINLLQEYLAFFPELSWEDPDMDRINIPGTVNETNWLYRTRPYVEDLIQHAPLQEKMRSFST